MTDRAIAANGLLKSYGDKTVLDGVDLATDSRAVRAVIGVTGQFSACCSCPSYTSSATR